MILRFLNLIVIGALVLAAAYVYRIKFDSAAQAEKLARLRSEVRHERDEIAALRAQWGELDNPARIEPLAKRYLQLKSIAPTQFDPLDHLPDRPPTPAEEQLRKRLLELSREHPRYGYRRIAALLRREGWRVR